MTSYPYEPQPRTCLPSPRTRMTPISSSWPKTTTWVGFALPTSGTTRRSGPTGRRGSRMALAAAKRRSASRASEKQAPASRISEAGVSEPGISEAGVCQPGISEPGADRGLSQQWHDIQAMFVDDPQGSVQRAAQAADAAVSTLADSLREQQAALIPADRDGNPGDTEQLRAALRSYRIFCQRIEELDAQLPRAATTRR